MTQTQAAPAPLVNLQIAMPTDPALSGIAVALAMAEAHDVVDAESLDLAGQTLREAVTRKKRLHDLRLELTRPIDASKQVIMDKFRPAIDGYEKIEGIYKRKIGVYDEQQRKLREAAERKARDEQQRLQREAEARAREQQRLADEEAACIQAEADAEAERLRSQGRSEEAAQVASQGQAEAQSVTQAAAQEVSQAAIPPPVAVAVPEPPKATGVSTSKVWKGEVVDLAALVLAVAADLARGDRSRLPFLKAADTVISAQARSLKEHFACPGIRVYPDTQVSARRKGELE